MMNMPYEELLKKLQEKSGLSKDELEKKVKEKLESLSGLISKEGAAHIIANELGVKLQEEAAGTVPIKNLLAGMRNVETAGKVTQKYDIRMFDKGDRKGSVANLLMNDGTSTIKVVFWNDQTEKFKEIEEGDVLKVESGFVKENNGRKELHLNTASTLSINPEDIKIEDAEPKNIRKKISELKENDEDVEVLGTIVQVFDPRFFEVCPECGKRLKKKEEGQSCDVHGIVAPDYSYVLNLFLDDGTSNIRVVLWKNQFQRLIGKSDEEIKKYRTEAPEFEKLRTEMLGNFIKIIGRVKKNEGFDSLELVAGLVFTDPDPKEEMKNLAPEDSGKEEDLKAAVADDFDDVVNIDDLEDVK